MLTEPWPTIISGGICINGCTIDLQRMDGCRVQDFQIARGGILRVGDRNSLYDITVDGNLFASNTFILKMRVPTGCARLSGSASTSNVFVGGHLEAAGTTRVTDLDVVCGGKVVLTDSAWINNGTLNSGAKLSIYGEAGANNLTISSGASVVLYGQARLYVARVQPGGYLECYDDTKTSDVWVAPGATFICKDNAEVVYDRDSPQKPIDFSGASASCGMTDHGLDTIYRAKVTVSENGAVEIQLPVPLTKVFQGSGGLSVTWKGAGDDKR